MTESSPSWGWNSTGQLGNGATMDSLAPVNVEGIDGKVTSITAGYNHTCALTRDGGAWCWGWNMQGQLGDGTSTNSSTPVQEYLGTCIFIDKNHQYSQLSTAFDRLMALNSIELNLCF